MTKIIFTRFFVTGLLIVFAACTLHAQKSPDQTRLRHVVLFKFKDTAKAEDVRQVEEAFRALPRKLSIIKDFEWGTNSSPENLNQGLTHCFLVTFSSDKDRDTYLTHPDHQAFVEVLKPHLDKVTVIDYWTK